MYLHEAIMATTKQKPFVSRAKWAYITPGPCAAAVKVLPTDSPDRCLIESGHFRPSTHWAPTKEDLIAQDWEPVS